MSTSLAPLPERIQNLIREIDAIKAELRQPAADPKTGLAIAKAPDTVVQQLKTAVDQFRLYLWAYLDTRAAGGMAPETRLQEIRTEAAADMLRQLSTDFAARGVPANPAANRLRDQLRSLASWFADAA